MQVLNRPPIQPSVVWDNLADTYGEAEIKRVLAKHPISVDKDHIESFGRSFEYCASWLQRYTPDLKTYDDLSRWSLRYLSAVPAILAPAAFVSVIQGSPIEHHVLLATIVVVGIILWVIRPPRTRAQLLPLLVFYRFIIAQFLVEAKPQNDDKTTAGPSSNDNPKSYRGSPVPATGTAATP
jgi:hypothetical protein